MTSGQSRVSSRVLVASTARSVWCAPLRQLRRVVIVPIELSPCGHGIVSQNLLAVFIEGVLRCVSKASVVPAVPPRVQSSRFPRGVGRSLSEGAIEAPSIATYACMHARGPVRRLGSGASTPRVPHAAVATRDTSLAAWRLCVARCMVLYSAPVRVRLQILFGICSPKRNPSARAIGRWIASFEQFVA